MIKIIKRVLSAGCLSTSVMCLFRSFACLKDCIIIFLQKSYLHHSFDLDPSPLPGECLQIILPLWIFYFYWVNCSFVWRRVLVWFSFLSLFLFLLFLLSESLENIVLQTNVLDLFPQYFLLASLQFQFLYLSAKKVGLYLKANLTNK